LKTYGDIRERTPYLHNERGQYYLAYTASHSGMQPERVRLREKRVPGREGDFILSLDREDYSSLYPGMLRYTVGVFSGEAALALFRTNSYEYAPRVPLQAEAVAYDRFAIWERELEDSLDEFFLTHEKPPPHRTSASGADLVVIAGSPRADGNCGILTEWATEAARHMGLTSAVIYPHDLDIRPCIGCYQCYNTGTCTFDDDMREIIDAIRTCRVLVVTSPVYTNTVPGTLKVLIDRCQAYHAERVLFGGPEHQRGILCAVAGRHGRSNFTCLEHVVHAFMRNIGIVPSGDLLADGTDEYQDIRTISGLREQAEETVRAALSQGA
jgi:multimeric flavodoxin WrbA